MSAMSAMSLRPQEKGNEFILSLELQAPSAKHGKHGKHRKHPNMQGESSIQNIQEPNQNEVNKDQKNQKRCFFLCQNILKPKTKTALSQPDPDCPRGDLRDPHSMSLHQSRVGVQLLGTLCCILHRSNQIDDPSGMG